LPIIEALGSVISTIKEKKKKYSTSLAIKEMQIKITLKLGADGSCLQC
jgi:hypothetical protein